jgi:polysaccharide export outer membrane protein
VLAKYIRDPIVTVIVGRLRRSLQRTDPRDRRSGQTAGACVQAEDDLARRDDRGRRHHRLRRRQRASILRTAEGDKQYNVRIKDLVKSRRCLGQRRDVKPGDILIIPQSWF